MLNVGGYYSRLVNVLDIDGNPKRKSATCMASALKDMRYPGGLYGAGGGTVIVKNSKAKGGKKGKGKGNNNKGNNNGGTYVWYVTSSVVSEE